MRRAPPHQDVAATRRLRPNVVTSDDSTFVEDHWSGATLYGAQAELRVVEGTERCTMVDYAQPGMPAVPSLLERLRTDYHAVVGKYVVGRDGDRALRLK